MIHSSSSGSNRRGGAVDGAQLVGKEGVHLVLQVRVHGDGAREVKVQLGAAHAEAGVGVKQGGHLQAARKQYVPQPVVSDVHGPVHQLPERAVVQQARPHLVQVQLVNDDERRQDGGPAARVGHTLRLPPARLLCLQNRRDETQRAVRLCQHGGRRAHVAVEDGARQQLGGRHEVARLRHQRRHQRVARRDGRGAQGEVQRVRPAG